MLKRVIVSLIFLVVFVNNSNAQRTEYFKEINAVWAKFYTAFETLDYNLMADIHSKDLVRVSGGKRMLNYDVYIKGYKTGFERDKEHNLTNEISLRFFERIGNRLMASERGIYRLTRNKGTENEYVSYGQFHVIWQRIDGDWKITLDYDSTESDTIGIEDYNKAYAIDNFDPFTK